MPIDNLEFIERQKSKQQPKHKNVKNSVKNVIVSAFFIVLYIWACIGLAILLDVNKTTFVLAGLLFVISGIVAFWAQRYFNKFKSHEKERLLIREVLAGSRGARMPTALIRQFIIISVLNCYAKIKTRLI